MQTTENKSSRRVDNKDTKLESRKERTVSGVVKLVSRAETGVDSSTTKENAVKSQKEQESKGDSEADELKNVRHKANTAGQEKQYTKQELRAEMKAPYRKFEREPAADPQRHMAEGIRKIDGSGVKMSPDNVDTVFITIPCLEAKEGKLVLLVDSGADSSIVKEEALEVFPRGNRRETKNLAGAFGGSVTTLCAVEINVGGRRHLPWVFHVVARGSGVPGDGILGRDNIWGKSVINSIEGTLKIWDNDRWVRTFSLQTALENSVGHQKIRCLEKRAVTVVPIKIDSKEKTVVVHKRKLYPGVYVGGAIVNVCNGEAKIPVLNATEENIPLREGIKVEFSNLNHYTVHTPQNSGRKPGLSRVERIRQVKKSIMAEANWNSEEKESMAKICERYYDTFMLDGDKLPFTSLVKHKIPTIGDQPPINQRQYRLPQVHKEEINRQVSELLREGIISPSVSPWNSPLLLVPKKSPDGQKKYRLVVDFRRLNEVTIKQVFPIPRIDEILDQLGNSRYFTTLDLASGYHQVLLDEQDKEKTAFSTDKGHFEFNRMPFGLTGAPATFQMTMNTILTGLQGLDCFVYLDDIVIYGRNVADHERKICNVLSRLRENGLKLNTNKCQFLRREIVYLGHKCSEKGALPDPAKVESVKNIKPPRNIKEVQALLGLVNYYRKFVNGMAKLASPISRLLKKNCKFVWSKECQEALNRVKESISNPPILIYPDFSEPFSVTTDASNEALGAILSQMRDGKDHPISFASRTLSDTEKRYSTIEKEMLGVVWATRTFRPYLLGRHFTIFTDHQPLKGIANLKDQTSRLARFRHKLSEYDFNIVYKPGKTNLNADALSRLPLKEQRIQVVTRAQQKRLKSESNKDNPDCREIIPGEKDTAKTPNNKTIDTAITLTNRSNIREILRSFHDSPLGGHQGVRKTYKRIRRQYKWKGMHQDIKDYIKGCQSCQKNKSGPSNKEPMVLTDTPSRPFEKIYMDMVGPLPTTTSGNKYILTFQDDLSKFFWCAPMPDAEAETVAKIFYSEIISKYGIPARLVTDNGTNFTAKLFGSVCKLLRIKKQHITPYHPQANGSLERSHRPLAEYLRSFAKEDGSNWDQWLAPAMHVHNHTDHASTNQTPFRVLYGFDTPLPSNLKVSTPLYNPYDYPKVLKHQIQRAHEMARKYQEKAKAQAKERYDKGSKPSRMRVGDKVLIKNQSRNNKLSPLWEGPYEVKGLPSAVNVQILVKGKIKVLHRNLVKPYKVSTGDVNKST